MDERTVQTEVCTLRVHVRKTLHMYMHDKRVSNRPIHVPIMCVESCTTYGDSPISVAAFNIGYKGIALRAGTANRLLAHSFTLVGII